MIEATHDAVTHSLPLNHDAWWERFEETREQFARQRGETFRVDDAQPGGSLDGERP